MLTKQTCQFSSIRLKIKKGKNPYQPLKQKIVGQHDTLKTLAYAVKTNKPVLLIGETGVGKTALIRYLAHRTNSPFRRINLNGQTTVDEFVGKTLINSKGTYWIDGILVEALKKGYWLLLDEINAALPEVLFSLHSLLDDDGYIVLAENKGKIVKPHPNFRLFCSMNPTSGYSGTKEMNRAFLSRFPIIIQLDFPTPDLEKRIIKNYVPQTSQKHLTALVEMASDLRNAYEKNEIDFVCSPRDLINCALIGKELKDFKKALALTILGHCSKDDRKAVTTIITLYFGRDGLVKSSSLKSTREALAEKLKEQQRRFDDFTKELTHHLKELTTCGGLSSSSDYRVKKILDLIRGWEEKQKETRGIS